MSSDKFIIGAADATNAADASLQPKLGYRFKVSFVGLGATTNSANSVTLTAYVNNVTPPDFQQEAVQIDAYVSRYYVLGKHTIGEISMELRSDASNVVVGEIQKQVDRQYNAFKQSHAPAAGSVKFVTKILYLDGSNNADGGDNSPRVLEGVVCTGCWISNVSWGQLSYASSDPVAISLTIRPDNFYRVLGAEIEGKPGEYSTIGTNEGAVNVGGSTAVGINMGDLTSNGATAV